MLAAVAVPAVATLDRAERQREQTGGNAEDEAEHEHGREWVHDPTPPTWYFEEYHAIIETSMRSRVVPMTSG
jgi:hypothetical protein